MRTRLLCCVVTALMFAFACSTGGASGDLPEDARRAPDPGISDQDVHDLSAPDQQGTLDIVDPDIPAVADNVIPDLPAEPDVTVSPDVPVVPDLPVLPDAPVIPDVPYHPDVVVVPDVAVPDLHSEDWPSQAELSDTESDAWQDDVVEVVEEVAEELVDNYSPLPPLLMVSSGPMEFEAFKGFGLPPAESFSIQAGGDLPLEWEVVVPPGFLAVPAQGIGPAQVAVSLFDLEPYPPGDYELEVMVDAKAALNSPAAIALLLHVEAQPELSVAGGPLLIEFVKGFPMPAEQNLQLSNVGGGKLEWTVAAPAGILVVPQQGSGSASLSVQFADPGLYEPGDYQLALEITAPNALSSPAVVPLTIHVEAQPALSVAGGPLGFATILGFPLPDSHYLDISNAGGGPLNWSLEVPVGFEVTPAGGAGSEVVEIALLDAGVYGPGDHVLEAKVTAENALGSPAVVNMALHVDAQPVLSVTGGPLAFAHVVGFPMPAAQLLDIANPGGGPLNWTLLLPAGFEASQVQGDGPAEVQIGYVGGEYEPGEHVLEAVLTAGNASGSPVAVPITLLVEAQPVLSVTGGPVALHHVKGCTIPDIPPLQIENQGGGPLDWQVGAPAGFEALPSNGSGPASVSLTYFGGDAHEPGDHELTIVVAAVSALQSPSQVPFGLQVEAQPETSVTGGPLAFSHVVGFPLPEPQYLDLANVGGGEFNWTVQVPAGFEATPEAGAGPQAVKVALVSEDTFGPGDHQAELSIVADCAKEVPVIAQLLLHVESQPSLLVEGPALAFSHVVGFPLPEPASLTLSNKGGGPLLWTATPPAGFAVEPPDGSGPAQLALSLIDPDAYPPGDYSLDLSVAATNALDSPNLLPIALHVDPSPVIGVPEQPIVFTGLADEFASAPVSVTPENLGGGQLHYTVTTQTPWLKAVPSEGGPGTSFEIQVLPDQVPYESGSFDGEIVVKTVPEGLDEGVVQVTLETTTRDAGPFTTEFTYDDGDRVTSVLFADGSKTTFDYGILNSPTQVVWPDETTFQYVRDEVGRILSISDPTGIMDYALNDFGQLEEATYPDGSAFGFAYDVAGRMVKLTYPDGGTVGYGYDEHGRLHSIVSDAGQTLIAWDDQGRMATLTYPGGVVTTYEYDQLGRVTAARTSRPGGELIVRYEQTFNNRGLRASLSEITMDDSRVVEFEYDSTGRLLSEKRPEETIEFQYDQAGRRINRTGPEESTAYAYDGDGRLVRAGETIFRYDERGRRTQRITPAGMMKYGHNHDDHLTSAKGQDVDVSYGHSPDGMRHSRSSGEGEEKRYQARVGGFNRTLYRETDTGQSVEAVRLVYGVGWLLEEEDGKPPRLVVQDLLGSVGRVLSQDGAVQLECSYGAFGQALSDSYFIGFRGEEQDPDTGFVYLRAREYDPETGVFLSKDSGPPRLGFRGTLDRYVYAGGDPVNHVDPDGRDDVMDGMEKVAKMIEEAKAKAQMAAEKIKDANDKGFAVKADGTIDLEYDLEGNVGWLGLDMEDKIHVEVPDMIDAVPEGCEVKGEAKWLNFPLWKWATGGSKVKVQESGHIDVDLEGDWGSVKGTIDFKLEVDGAVYGTKAIPTDIDLGDGNRGYISGGPPNGPGGGSGNGIGNDGFGGDGFSGYQSSPKGGVALNKAATVLAELGDIDGATYDPVSGQLVLYGPDEHTTLPQMSMDDLVASYRAVFKHTDDEPGVTMGNVPPPAGFEGEHGVKYFAGVQDTYIGWVFFEADRMLKIYTMGEDNITHQPVQSQVPEYMSMLERTLDNELDEGPVQNRMWFVPNEVELIASPDSDSAMVFSKASVKVLTESKMTGQVFENPDAEAFASHFTEYYDLFGHERPVLQELQRVMKIVSVLQWMRDEDIPMDTEWFDRYDLPHYETPLWTPKHQVSDLSDDGTIEFTISGGVSLKVENSYDVAQGQVAQKTAASALNARPEEKVQNWDFEEDGESKTATALSVARVPRAGYRYHVQQDAVVDVPGRAALELTRYCAPFDVAATEFGHCWHMRPTSLRHTGEAKWVGWDGYPDGRKVPAKVTLLSRRQNKEVEYKFKGASDGRLLYLGEFTSDGMLFLNNDDTWSLESTGVAWVGLSFEGNLMWEADRSGNTVVYDYDQGRVVSVTHSAGQAVGLSYDELGRIQSAALPGGLTVSYGYDEAGNLSTVTRADGLVVALTYDQGHVPLQSTLGDSAAYATYDFLGRPTAMGVSEDEAFLVEYGDYGHQVTITSPEGHMAELLYEARMRPETAIDPLGRKTEYEYEDATPGPAAVTDPLGRTTYYAYDASGRVVKAENAAGAKKSIHYINGLKTGLSKTGAPDVYIQRDEKNRPSRIYHEATLILQDGALTGANINDCYTDYTYDEHGEVASVTRPDGTSTAFTRDAAGRPTTIQHPGGVAETRAYDEAGRVTSLGWTDGTSLEISYHQCGVASEFVAPYGTHTLSVDDNCRITAIADPSGATTGYQYDEYGQFAGLQNPDGGQLTYQRDIMGRITKAVDSSGLGASMKYDAVGRVTSVTTGQLEQ